MPVLLYAVEVIPLAKTDVVRLDHALIFGSSSSVDIT